MKYHFTKITITAVIILISNQTHADGLQCPYTLQQQHQIMMYQNGYINPDQQYMLQQQCYYEAMSYQQAMIGMPQQPTGDMPQKTGAGIPQQSGMGTPTMGGCSSGMFKGQNVHPDRCLAGQGIEIIVDLLKN